MGDPSRVRVTGPLERYAAGFVAELVEAGYRPNAAAVQLRLLKHLSGWLEQEGIDPGDLRESQLERFRREHLARVVSLRIGQGLVRVLSYLRALGVVPPAVLPERSIIEALLDRYREYLLVERGLTAETARGYVDLVQPFVVTRVRGGQLDLASLTPADVLGFVLAACRHRPQRSGKMLVTALRSCWCSCTWRG